LGQAAEIMQGRSPAGGSLSSVWRKYKIHQLKAARSITLILL